MKIAQSPGFSRGEFVNECITALVHIGHVMPCQSEETVEQVKKSCERLNAHICQRSNFEKTIEFLASPLTGCGVQIGRFQQIFLAQYKAGNKTVDKLAAATWKIISRNNEVMIDENKKVFQTPKENIAYLKTLAETFLKWLPILNALLI